MKNLTNKKILIVDDDPINLCLLDNLFDSEHTVIISTNGMDAIAKTIKQSPDLILLDIMLPDINGFEVCRQIKQNTKTENIPVVFISASDLDRHINKGFEVGAVDYIIKPFNSKNILQRLSSYLSQSPYIRN